MSKCLRLENEIALLRQELGLMRGDRDELYKKHAIHLQNCSGGDNCKKFHPDKEAPDQHMYIAYLEEQIRRTRLIYQKQMSDVKSSALQLESRLQKVRQDMGCITARARLVEKLQRNVQLLKTKLQRRDTIIARCNTQNTALVELISNLDQPSTQEDTTLNQIGVLSKMDIIGNSDQADIHNKNVVTDSNCKSKPSAEFSCLSTALRIRVQPN